MFENLAQVGGFQVNWVMMPPMIASQSLATYATRYAPYVDFFPYR